jgi:asparagine synthase (glutamine-hydrolysing)
MSNVYGIFNHNNTSVELVTFHAMKEAISYWHADDSGEYNERAIALGHKMLWNIPESKYEHLPLEKDALVLTMDARIDNREELLKELELPHRPLIEIGDSEFILAAYQKWGEECPKHLLGDFAFAIWDIKKQLLFCARDHIGIKPFYYYLDDEKFIFCSDIRGLLAHIDIPQTINDEAMAIFLRIGELWHPTMTFFSAIQKLPPATTMSIASSKISQNIYWKAEASPKIRFNSLDEYVEVLRALIEDAVHKRVRSTDPIVSHLSGGLDSSTIAVLAARHLRAKNRELYAYSWSHSPKEGEDSTVHEWANSIEIANLEKIQHSYIELNVENLTHILSNHDITINGTSDLWYEDIVRDEAIKIGARTILSGWGGDEFITYSGSAATTELLYQGHIFNAFKIIYQRHKNSPRKWRSIMANFYHQLFLPFLPENLYRFLPKVPRFTSYNYLLHYIKSDFLKRANLQTQSFHAVSLKSCRIDQLDRLHQGHLQNRIESWASSSRGQKIEYVYPLLDKRIVEFSLGIPSELYNNGNIGRLLYRHAVNGILPDHIRWINNLKIETNRISHLRLTEKVVLTKLLEKLQMQKQIDNPYIEINKLFEDIKKLNINSENTLTEEEIFILNGLDKAILMLMSSYLTRSEHPELEHKMQNNSKLINYSLQLGRIRAKYKF